MILCNLLWFTTLYTKGTNTDIELISVPSKVLSYLCAGRTQLLAINEDNQAAKMVLDSNSGIVVAPDDDAAFVAAADELLNSYDISAKGEGARAFAEKSFDISAIVERVLGVIE